MANWINELVVVTIERDYDFITSKVIVKNKLKDFVAEAVSQHGKNITIYYNKAYIAFDGSIEKSEYLGTVDICSCLNY